MKNTSDSNFKTKNQTAHLELLLAARWTPGGADSTQFVCFHFVGYVSRVYIFASTCSVIVAIQTMLLDYG